LYTGYQMLIRWALCIELRIAAKQSPKRALYKAVQASTRDAKQYTPSVQHVSIKRLTEHHRHHHQSEGRHRTTIKSRTDHPVLELIRLDEGDCNREQNQ
jgi:predicted RNA-binding protein YlxR (DUF448 family)